MKNPELKEKEILALKEMNHVRKKCNCPKCA
jgi:hypothetical protein